MHIYLITIPKPEVNNYKFIYSQLKININS